MMDEKRKIRTPEQATALLKARVKKQRPRKLSILLLLVAVFAVPVGFLGWWFWPPPEPPPLLVVAFDHLTTPKQSIILRARLEPLPGADVEANLGDWPVYFEEISIPGLQPAKTWHYQTKSQSDGAVSARFRAVRRVERLDFVVRYAPKSRKEAAEDRGWLYCLDPQTPLLIVDVERTLTTAQLSEWTSKNIYEIPGQHEAIRALKSAAQKKRYQVVYLACASENAAAYRNVRGWVKSVQLKDGTRCPRGPVLGRVDYVSKVNEDVHLKERLLKIKDLFQGEIVCVTSHIETAEVFHQSGVKTILVSNFPKELAKMSVVKKWSDLLNHLP